MQVVETVNAYREACDAIRLAGNRIGFVPTMGALHAGHASLMRRAKQEGFVSVVSIFVNPTQFGPNEDFERYPRTLQTDLELCASEGVGLVFTPSVVDMYPGRARTRVSVSELTESLCGASRPGHFDGVATVVSKFFNATGPCSAFFGRKDYQQYRVICAMVTELLMPISVVGCPTWREADGLAMSSRNRYLSADERVRALGIARGLALAEQAFRAGERAPKALLELVRQSLVRSQLREDYVALRDPSDLAALELVDRLPERTLLAIAVYCGSTRLIDNLVLGEETAPVVLGAA